MHLIGRFKKNLETYDYAWVLFFVFIISIIHFYFPHPVDHDTAYHFAVGKLINTHGILYSFPWTQFSTQFDNYADKEFLFHLLFVPLHNLDLISASRLVGILTGTAVLVTLYTILRIERVPYAGLWSILPLFSCDFIFRFAQVRPHILSITLAFILIWAVSREKSVIVLLVSILYPLTYVAFWQMPLIVISCAEIARFISSKRINWKIVPVSTVGISIGLLLHPNSRNLLMINWTHMADALIGNAWGKAKVYNLGSEFYPYSLAEWEKYLAVTVVVAVTSLYLAGKNRRVDSFPLAMAFTALVFGILTVESRRFLEYFIPVSTAALALSSSIAGRKNIAYYILALSLGHFLLIGIKPLKEIREKVSMNTVNADFRDVLRSNIPADAQIFTTGWHYTGDLMLALPERRFLIAGEPTLMYKKDPKIYNYWYFLPYDVFNNPAQIIRTVYRSRFIISENIPAYWRFFATLRQDKSVKQLYSGTWVLFDLGQ